MVEQLINYIHRYIDESASIERNDAFLSLPMIYQEEYRFYNLKIIENMYVLIEPNSKLLQIEHLKKQINFIESELNNPIILYVRQISSYRMKELVKERISFTNGLNSLYIYPNIIWNKTNNSKDTKVKLSSNAQSIIRYFLFDRTLSLNNNQVSQLIKLGEMSASRGLRELYQQGLLDYQIIGKTKRTKTYHLSDEKDVFNRILALCESPVKRVVYIKETPEKAVVSGYTALCIRTQMQDDGIKRYAMHINDFKKLDIPYQEDAFSLRIKEYHELELWAYQPSLHGDSIIDDFSLLCLFKEGKEERIKIELESLAGRCGWSMELNDL